jgi:hypothetical protein
LKLGRKPQTDCPATLKMSSPGVPRRAGPPDGCVSNLRLVSRLPSPTLADGSSVA